MIIVATPNDKQDKGPARKHQTYHHRYQFTGKNKHNSLTRPAEGPLGMSTNAP